MDAMDVMDAMDAMDAQITERRHRCQVSEIRVTCQTCERWPATPGCTGQRRDHPVAAGPEFRIAARPSIVLSAVTGASRLSSAALRVPSAISHPEWNYLLNPAHPQFAQLRLGVPTSFTIDPRVP